LLVDSGKEGPYVLNSNVEKVIKEVWDKKPTGGNSVPEDVLILLGEDN
jgi:predicted oxidoreductase (fatty acid repression mutant protein)